MRYPEPVQRLIDAFLILPGIGRRTAIRFAYSIVHGNAKDATTLAEAILGLHQNLTRCHRCLSFSEKDPCVICSTTSREQGLLCVVADDRTLNAIEDTGIYHGLYFVLGGVLNPIDGITTNQLSIAALHHRLGDKAVTEIILVFDSDTNGEATASYLAEELRRYGVPITKPARGLPAGYRLEYADEMTLGSAITERKNTKKL